MQSEVATGSVLAGFRVESLIGTGAMGTVYLAEDTNRGGRVALKLLAPELARNERFRQRFLREAQLAASLDHPHIVPTLASGEEDGALYLAMAYVEGSDLRELLRREDRLAPERALDLVAQVAEALDAAHAARLVHRDVKPGNILVTTRPDGEHAYVCDFGLARHVTSVSSLTGDRGFVGTIDYVPPEQIDGGQSAEDHADLDRRCQARPDCRGLQDALRWLARGDGHGQPGSQLERRPVVLAAAERHEHAGPLPKLDRRSCEHSDVGRRALEDRGKLGREPVRVELGSSIGAARARRRRSSRGALRREPAPGS